MKPLHQITQGNWAFYHPCREQRSWGQADRRVLVLHPDRVRIVACFNTGVTWRGDSIPMVERLANAQLTACAPRMLTLLHKLAPHDPEVKALIAEATADVGDGKFRTS